MEAQKENTEDMQRVFIDYSAEYWLSCVYE